MNNADKLENIRIFIEKENCKLLSKSYKNSKEKLKIKLECGHIKEMSFEVFKRGHRCLCDYKQRMKTTIQEKTREKLLLIISQTDMKFICFENDFASWGNKITYECPKGHIETRTFRNFNRHKGCVRCSRISSSNLQSGKKGSNWKGGITGFRKYIQGNIVQWKKDSIEACGYKCVITGERFDDIHHLYPLNYIIKDALNELDFEKYDFTGDYLEEEINLILEKIIEIHYRYPLGVCLKKSIHKKFHKLYSNNCSPNDFYDFVEKIKSGEIKI